jgi:hypothetical protein
MEDPWPGSWFLSNYCVLFMKPPQAARQSTQLRGAAEASQP